MKKDVWKHLWELIRPKRWRFIAVVCIALMSTGAGLIEPLIYREAVNDVAGLFVKGANDSAKVDAGEELETSDDPIEGFLHAKIQEVKQQRDAEAETAELPASTTHEKTPHSRTEVAERTPGEAVRTLMNAVGFLLLVNVLSYILWLVAENMNTRLDCEIEQDFIQRAFGHVLRLPLAFFSKRSPATLTKQIDQSEQVSEILNAFSQQLLPETISLFGILAIMFYQNAMLALVSISIIPFYLLIAWRSSKKLESNLSVYYDQWEEVSARITTALDGIKTVKLSGAEGREVGHYMAASTPAYDGYVRRSLMSNTFTFWQGILTHLATAMVLGYGGYLALVHRLTPGDVVMFVSYLDRLYSPIDELCSLWVNLQQHLASISRAFRLLGQPQAESPGTPLRLGKGLVEFREVTFGYVPDHVVLERMSLRFVPGKLTAVVGGSGAGKTTMADLLLKLFQPQHGRILIDGQDIAKVDGSSVRDAIGVVAADGAIFRGTLRYNLCYKKPDASDAEVMAAVAQAGLKNLVARLPEGLETQIGQNGMGLSVGERQRVQIARILVSKPKILILDEATANLDYNTEAEVKHAIDALRGSSTIIVIAHRFSMVRDADDVYVLGEGKVLEHGTPAHLAQQGGWFADFANAAEEDVAEDEVEEEAAEEEEEDTDEEEEEPS